MKTIHNSLEEWRLNEPEMYTKAVRRGLIDIICEKTGWENTSVIHINHTLEGCIESAKNFNRIIDWQKSKEHIRFYNKAVSTPGWINECSKHMTQGKRPITKIECILNAKKYTTKKEWFTNDNRFYCRAVKQKWMEDCCKHMIIYVEPTLKDCVESAKNFNRRVDWKNSKDHNKFYRRSLYKKWTNECCKHMV